MSRKYMQKYKRVPAMEQSLKTMIDAGLNIETVVDVGILTGTGALIQVFHESKHILFEPLEDFNTSIEGTYRNIDYELHNLAVSDSDGVAYQVAISSDNSGKTTHSYISTDKVTKLDEPRLVEVSEVKKVSLDTFYAEAGSSLSKPILLKVDVDGHELPILEGADRFLDDVAVVIIEAPLPALYVRMKNLVEKGYVLWDIVDPCYYSGALWQVDLIMIHESYYNNNDKLRPMQTKEKLEWEKWYPYES